MWCLDGRGSVTRRFWGWGKAGTRTTLGSLPLYPPSSFAQGDPAEASVVTYRTVTLHGFLHQLSLMMSPITLWVFTSVSGSFWERQDEIADRDSTAETNAPVADNRWVPKHSCCIDACNENIKGSLAKMVCTTGNYREISKGCTCFVYGSLKNVFSHSLPERKSRKSTACSCFYWNSDVSILAGVKEIHQS